MHQASTAVKLQALSKRAVLSLPAPASTASTSSSSRPQIEISTSVMEAATGAFIHSTEDDTARVGCCCRWRAPLTAPGRHNAI